jgi:hypothetical protein
MAPFRLAILETDTPVPNVFKERGSYGSVFETLLSKGLVKSDKKLDYCVLKYDVVQHLKYPEPSEIDGILITGSSLSALPCLALQLLG